MDPYEMIREMRRVLELPDRELHDLQEEWDIVVARVHRIRQNLIQSAS